MCYSYENVRSGKRDVHLFLCTSRQTRDEMPLFHENTDTAEFDQFMQNIPRESISVCGKTYRCQSTANGDLFWSTKGDVGHSSRDCNVDMLVAAAHANNCNVSRQYKSVPVDCLRENPILRRTGRQRRCRCAGRGDVRHALHGGGALEVRREGVSSTRTRTIRPTWRTTAAWRSCTSRWRRNRMHPRFPLRSLLPCLLLPRPLCKRLHPRFLPPPGEMTSVTPERAWTACTLSTREQKRARAAWTRTVPSWTTS